MVFESIRKRADWSCDSPIWSLVVCAFGLLAREDSERAGDASAEAVMAGYDVVVW